MTPEQNRTAAWGQLIVDSLGAEHSNIIVRDSKKDLEKQLREKCAQCKTTIPPGKLGRLCKQCRQEHQT